jgi:hypothetical protein
MSDQAPPPPETRRRPPLSFGGFALVALGVLILVPSGLCTGIGGIVALSAGGDDMATILPVVLMFGVPALLLGWFLVWLGLKVRRRD